MGICSSSSKSISAATAKLILDDGRLQEFPYPVKVSYVLQKINSTPSCFICSSDEMDFDGVVSAVSDEDELQPGQLYFALPLCRLRRRLQAEEMAALAVKASSALSKYCCNTADYNSYFVDMSRKPGRKVQGESITGSRRRTVGRAVAGQKGKFAASLTAIPE